SGTETILSSASCAMSYIIPEILSIDETVLNRVMEANEDFQKYKHTLDEMNRHRPHVLSEREAALLAKAAEPLNNAGQTFTMLNNDDLTFPTIKNEQGEDVQLTHGRYIGFLESKDRNVRKQAFKAMYETYGQFINTFAATLSGTVKKNNF